MVLLKNVAIPDLQMPFTSGGVEVSGRIVTGDSVHWIRRLKERGYFPYRGAKCHWRGGRVTKLSILCVGRAGTKQKLHT